MGTRYVGTNLDLRTYLMTAFQVRPEQIVGGPAWLRTERYNLNAKAGKPSTLDQLHTMLQNLLIERMKLRYHIEKKEMAAEVLSVAKNGPKSLKPHPDATGTDFFLDQEMPQLAHVRLAAHCASMDFMAFRLSQALNGPVVNQTGLAGCFDFELKYVQGPPPAPGKEVVIVNGVSLDLSGPRIYDALEEQLGLKLESKRAPVNTMVIDYAEKPAED